MTCVSSQSLALGLQAQRTKSLCLLSVDDLSNLLCWTLLCTIHYISQTLLLSLAHTDLSWTLQSRLFFSLSVSVSGMHGHSEWGWERNWQEGEGVNEWTIIKEVLASKEEGGTSCMCGRWMAVKPVVELLFWWNKTRCNTFFRLQSVFFGYLFWKEGIKL